MLNYLAKLTGALPLLVTAVALVLLWQAQRAPVWSFAERQIAVPDAAAAPRLSCDFASSAPDRFVHAASITALPDGRLLASWFGGSREGARDVKIYGAWFDPKRGGWGAEQVLVSRPGTEQAVQRTIRKLGNPVVSQAPDGKLWLFYVSVSIGGWAGSAINATYSVDGGNSWSTPRRLVTSPFLNISTLVKGTPVYYRDGSIGLPVYHEFLGKFAELLHLSATGEVMDKIRISHGKHSLQPVVVPRGERDATALMRYAGAPPKRMLASHSDDGGKHWPVPHATGLANPNSALTATRLADGSILGVMNDVDDGRHKLGLLRSTDEGEQWQLVERLEGYPAWEGKRIPPADYEPLLEQAFLQCGEWDAWQRYRQALDKRVCEDGSCRFIYDYPYMIQADDGEFHLVYTWNKSYIKHLRFNQAWLDTRL